MNTEHVSGTLDENMQNHSENYIKNSFLNSLVSIPFTSLGEAAYLTLIFLFINQLKNVAKHCSILGAEILTWGFLSP